MMISTFIAGPYKLTLIRHGEMYQLVVSDGDSPMDTSYVMGRERALQRYEEMKAEIIVEVAKMAMGLN